MSNKSKTLIKNYAENLGFEYLTANSKDSFLSVVDRFLTQEITDCPILFEVFTHTQDESVALEQLSNYVKEHESLTNFFLQIKKVTKAVIQDTLGTNRIKAIKDFIKG